MSAEPAPISGLLIVDKPTGYTSMDVCAIVRSSLRAGGAPKGLKVGHAGTLDPAATGVLVVLVGRATRLSDRFMSGAKRYLGEVRLGRVSTTDDVEGEIREVDVLRPPTRGEVEGACAAMVGTIEQTPPAFSAVKVGGRRAYKTARAGGTPRLAPRRVRIDSIVVTGYEWPVAGLDVCCGKGVYIRSLARDLGEALGTGGMLASLRRVRVGEFTIEQAVPLERLPRPMGAETLLRVPEA